MRDVQLGGGAMRKRAARRVTRLIDLVFAGLILSSGALSACGGSDGGEEPGTIRVTIDGLQDDHTVTLRAHYSNFITGDSVEIWFEDVGNGSHSEEAPPRRYELSCAPPEEPAREYRTEGLAESATTLAPAGVIEFRCSYVRLASLRVVFEGLDDTIPDDWSLATITKEPEGTRRSVGRAQSGEPIRLEPGTHEIQCNEVVGNSETTRFRLAGATADRLTLGPGEAGEVTCTYEGEP